MKFIEGMFIKNKENVVTPNQIAIVITTVGWAYKTDLKHLNGKVTARYVDYEGNLVDYNGEIIFEFDGEQQAVQAVNGVAEIPFVVVDSGTYIVRTANPDIENGEVTINA